jgi:hypothetical protein
VSDLSRAELEIINEISKDVRDTYDLLYETYVELRLIRKLAEMQVLQSRDMKKEYERERRRIETEAPRVPSK